MGNKTRFWRQVKKTFIPALANAKAYCPFSLLSFMQKMMQNLMNRNMKDETLGHVPYIYNNLPINQGSPQKLQCTM